jgi:hypothetical protein
MKREVDGWRISERALGGPVGVDKGVCSRSEEDNSDVEKNAGREKEYEREQEGKNNEKEGHTRSGLS